MRYLTKYVCYFCRSRCLLSNLVRTVGVPNVLITPLAAQLRRAEHTLQEVTAMLQDMSDFPVTNPDAFYPLEMFLHQEVSTSRRIVDQLTQKVVHLLNVAKGVVAMTPETEKDLVTIAQQMVPLSWTSHAFPSCTSAITWVTSLKKSLKTLGGYVTAMSGHAGPTSYNLAAFHRPDAFIHCILQEFVRREFKDLHSCQLHVQVIYVRQLYICVTVYMYIRPRLYRAALCATPSFHFLRYIIGQFIQRVLHC